MTLAAAVCFVVAALAELSGILLIVREAQAAQRALKEWRGPASVKDLDGSSAAFRRRDVTLAHYQQEADDVVIAHLLGSQAKRWAAVALLFVGVLAGTLGNFLSLSW